MGQAYLLAPLFFHPHGQFRDNTGDRYAQGRRIEAEDGEDREDLLVSPRAREHIVRYG